MEDKDPAYQLGTFVGGFIGLFLQGLIIFLMAWPLWWGLLPLFPWLEMARFGAAIASGAMILRFIFNRDAS
jgi:hypothetical protein